MEGITADKLDSIILWIIDEHNHIEEMQFGNIFTHICQLLGISDDDRGMNMASDIMIHYSNTFELFGISVVRNRVRYKNSTLFFLYGKS